jgi:signal transduction histidine kinase
MSIRLRLTLLYTAILALTLVLFGTALYAIQAQYTLDSLRRDLRLSGGNIARGVLFSQERPAPPKPEADRPPPSTFESFSNDPAFQGLREREIVRVLDADGVLIASPFGATEDALPLSAAGLQELQNQNEWWEISATADGRLMIYNRPVINDGEVISIVQVARPLAERDRTLFSLGTTLLVAILLTTLVAFGIGWVFAGVILRPIHRITQTAQTIANESGTNELALARRVDYGGPNDEIGQLATTFNTMLARLQDAYQRVSKALSLQRDFVADVSHELRTPLTTVHGNLALLRRDPPLPKPEQDDILKDVVEESDRLIRLVNDLLVLARADTGRPRIQEPVAVQTVVAEACKQARQLVSGREIIEAAEELTALGDRDSLKQVLLIILDNALKYSQDAITVSVSAEDGQAVISVQDQGAGIPAETLEHVFDRFYRGETDQYVSGFGLGLPIAKALVEEQGGKISMESKVGSGSIVTIYLPLLHS